MCPWDPFPPLGCLAQSLYKGSFLVVLSLAMSYLIYISGGHALFLRETEVSLGERGCVGGLRGVEEEKTAIRMYCMREEYE